MSAKNQYRDQREDPAPALREIDKLEKKRKTLVAEIQKQEQEYTSAALLENYTESHATSFLSEISENMKGMDREALKDLLSSISVGVIPRSLLRI